MQNPKLGDASFAMTTICCNYHDWGDSSFDLENLFKPHDEYEIDKNVCIEWVWKSVNFRSHIFGF